MFYEIEDKSLSRTILKTRRKILEASFRLFCTNGILKTTMVDIAGEVEVTRRTLYNHYNTKEEIALLLHRLMIEDMLSGCELRLEPHEVTKAGIMHCLSVLYHTITGDRDRMTFLVLFDQYAGENPELFDLDDLFVEYLLENTPITKYLGIIRDDGCFIDETVTPELLARVFFESLIAYIERIDFRDSSYEQEGFRRESGFPVLSEFLLSSLREGCR